MTHNKFFALFMSSYISDVFVARSSLFAKESKSLTKYRNCKSRDIHNNICKCIINIGYVHAHYSVPVHTLYTALHGELFLSK